LKAAFAVVVDDVNVGRGVMVTGAAVAAGLLGRVNDAAGIDDTDREAAMWGWAAVTDADTDDDKAGARCDEGGNGVGSSSTCSLWSRTSRSSLESALLLPRPSSDLKNPFARTAVVAPATDDAGFFFLKATIREVNPEMCLLRFFLYTKNDKRGRNAVVCLVG
jgi:hypothetical protein